MREREVNDRDRTGAVSRARSGIRPFLGDRRGLIAALITSSLASGLLESAILALVAQIAATLVNGGTHIAAELGPVHVDAGIGQLLAVAFVLAATRLVLGVIVAYLPARISADVQAQLRNNLFAAFNDASWSVQAEERDGHLQELVTSQLVQATQGVLQAAALVSAGFTFLALVVSALVLSVPVALVVIAAAGLLFVVLRPMNKVGHRQARALSGASLEYARGVSEAVRLAEETQVFGAAAEQRRQVEALAEDASGFLFRTQFLGRLVQGTYQSLVIVLLVGGLAGLYWSGAGRIATLGAVVLMLVRSAAYGQQAQGAYHMVRQATPFLDRLHAAEDRYRSSASPVGDQPFPRVASVAFDCVSFAYRSGTPVLSDVTFESFGEAIGIVGPSGAGKSTLLQILLRLREPDSGRVLINGLPVSAISRNEWCHRVAYVPQEPRLLHATVADNIRYFRDVDDHAVEQAARLAHIHNDIEMWSHGYETVIGQRADAISGGQRQRICLARALANSPALLVLDEPTSALDLHSESLVQESLAGLRGQLALFIVAHRLSTLSVCDRVMVMVDGRLEAFGPMAEIERTNAFYRSAAALSAGTR
jgi:ATP-binding cassette subfamily B protein